MDASVIVWLGPAWNSFDPEPARSKIMLRSAAAVVCLMTVSSFFLLPGCADSCDATPDKLSALRRGMTYAETAQVMGCAGKVVSRQGPKTAELSTVQWPGPGPAFTTRTQIDFREGRLLSFTADDVHWF